MATKNKNNYDADYDRWGAAPGSIKIIKPKKKTSKKNGTSSKKGAKK